MNIIPEKIETINRIFDEKEDILKTINNLNLSKIKNLKVELKNKVDTLSKYVENITDLKTDLKHLKDDKYALVHELDDTKVDMEKMQKIFPKETLKMKNNTNLENILSPTTDDNSSSKYLTSFFMKIGYAAKMLQDKLSRFDD